MSEGDVSLIRDEDLLRRMWQQTEDFSRKKEIRAHMYRLREERLRNLYSPEPSAEGKGVEAAQTHVKSLLDQSFQGLKSKEVRDAGSPPKDYTYRGQDLKDLSNAGWNVESENRTTDDGHTHVRAVHANIEGRYDVDGGKGQFAAVDHHKQAVTDYHDDNTSLKRNESSSNTAAHEQVVRKTDNGTEFMSTKSSSSSSNFQQVSSTKYEVPYSNDNYDQSRNTNLAEERRQVTRSSDYEQNMRGDYDSAELMSRKVEYPDDNTKVIIETKRLPDGTRVTSTRREFRAPVHSSRSEQHFQTKNEVKSSQVSHSTSSQQRSDHHSSKIMQEYDSRSDDIVDSQRHADDYDFKRNEIEYLNKKNDLSHTKRTNQQRHETKKFDTRESSSKVTQEIIDQVIDNQSNIDTYNSTNKQQEDHLTQKKENSTSEHFINKRYEDNDNNIDMNTVDTLKDNQINRTSHRKNYSTTQHNYRIEKDQTDHCETTARDDTQNIRNNIKESRHVTKNDDEIYNISTERKTEENVEKKTSSDRYQTTYQTDFTQKKVSNDWSPTHQAWASTLRADTPPTSRSTTRASSPGSKTFQSSTSSLRSSVSPDKTTRKPPSRGGSPNKVDRYSPSHNISEKYSTTSSTHSVTETRTNRYSPERMPPSAARSTITPERKPRQSHHRSSQSPEKGQHSYGPNISPDRKPGFKSSTTEDHPRTRSPSKPTDRIYQSPERKPKQTASEENPCYDTTYRTKISTEKESPINFPTKPRQSPEKSTGNRKPTDHCPNTDLLKSKPVVQDNERPSASLERSSGYNQPEQVLGRNSVSPDRKPGYMRPTASTPTSTKYPSPHRKSPEKQLLSKTANTKEDHYKFIDEETKMYIHSNSDDTHYIKELSHITEKNENSHKKCLSPMRTNSNNEPLDSRPESPSLRSSLRKGSRSPSPPKGPVTFTQDEIKRTVPVTTEDHKQDFKIRASPARESSLSNYKTVNEKQTEKVEEITMTAIDNKYTKYDSLKRLEQKDSVLPISPTKTSSRKSPGEVLREPSPTKFGTYNKKHRNEEVITVSEGETDFKYDSMKKQEKTSPKKSTPNLPESPIKKSPRDSTSPVKSPPRDTKPKHKHTSDFIVTEKKIEEINKKTIKDHPRQLITPSTSPTRKPKDDETAPSTGQSSPTTSVSGFIYYSSTKTDRTLVTDLDDEFHSEIDKEITATIKRPDSLNVERSQSPSKIPCRSPSLEKRVSPNKDNLPRKSSLKKTSADSQMSPSEKPPTNFRVSPSDEDNEVLKHKVVKKDRPDSGTFTKPKPPLERRETYEERCRKILGMMDDNKTKETILRQPDSNVCSPNISSSPPSQEASLLTYKKETTSDLSDFISHEQEDTIKNIKTQQNTIVTTANKSKIPSRDSSPTKLQDIITQHDVTGNNFTNITTENTTLKSTHDSVDLDIEYKKPKNKLQETDQPNCNPEYPPTSSHRQSVSPDKKTSERSHIPDTKRLSQSPDRKSKQSTEPKITAKSSSSRPTLEMPSLIKETPNIASPEKHTSIRPSVSPDRKPNYLRPTASTTTKFESSTISTEKLKENTKIKAIQDYSEDDQKPNTISNNGPEVKLHSTKNNDPDKKPTEKKSKPRSSESPDRTTTVNYESSSEDAQETITTEILRQSTDRETGYCRNISPSRPTSRVHDSPQRVPSSQQPSKTERYPSDTPSDKISSKHSVSPDKKPNYMRPTTSSTTKNTEVVTNEIISECMDDNYLSQKQQHIKVKKQPLPNDYEPKPPHTSSPPNTVTEATTNIVDFIQSEREHEVLNRVQQSLRKLSPYRDQRSLSREKSPDKTSVSLLEIDISKETTNQEDTTKYTEITEEHVSRKSEPIATNTSKGSTPSSKPPSRNTSPTKKSIVNQSKADKNTDSPNKHRSVSPKKPASSFDRPQSPHVPKTSSIKPKEPITSQIKKPTSSIISPTRIEKAVTEVKKITGITKQNSFTKTSHTKTTSTTSKLPSPTKPEPETKRIPISKSLNKENVSPKKDDTRVTRTTSDNAIRYKMTSPQRIKSKPEIQVSDMSSKVKHTTTMSKTQKLKEPQSKLAPKPKSATALNTSHDEDDIIIDVELAKSSRENSPDRICPTPVNFTDDIGTPRFPDEVSEPDDEFRRRTHHTIHEAESIVDDIVEICEDDELFVKKTDIDKITHAEDYLLSVTDKISKFTNKGENITKSKDATTQLKNNEKRVHSDFANDLLKSDDCRLTVSEKVSKFAQGLKDTDRRSPSRRIVDEYDTETIYQDDYTKLSVNDKAHLFVETAENSKLSKIKPIQKIERPDLSHVDESLKSDDCMLSVSDKVNKFVKTAEQFLTETHESEENVKKVNEQYDKIMKHITQDENHGTCESKPKIIDEEIKISVDNKSPNDTTPSYARDTTSSHSKFKDYSGTNLKSTDKVPIAKLTTLRSSEAVKKAKALFENIASTQKTKEVKTTKLTDIGVLKKTPKSDSNVDDIKLNVTDLDVTDSEVDIPHVTSSERSITGSRLHSHQGGNIELSTTSTRPISQSPEVPRTKSPTRQTIETTTTTTKTVLARYPGARTESPKPVRPELERLDSPQEKPTKFSQVLEEKDTEKNKPQEKIPNYQRPTKTSQIKEEKSVTEDTEVSTRRGSGKFGVELRKTSVERSPLNTERRRSSTEHHQPCIEDIFDLDLLEQMLEKVVGYEQRRRIRAQIRVTKKKMETEFSETAYTKTNKHKNKSTEHKTQTKTAERLRSTPHKTLSPERKSVSSKTIESVQTKESSKPLHNGHSRDSTNFINKRQRTESPEKNKVTPKTYSPVRQPSPDKKTRLLSSPKTPPKTNTNKFNEYASAYMKKVGLSATDKAKHITNTKTSVMDSKDYKMDYSKTEDYESVNQFEENVECKTTTMSKTISERTLSKDTIEIVHLNGKRSPSPEKGHSPQRRIQSPGERLYQRTPSPDFKRTKSDRNETITKTVIETEPTVIKKETIIKTVCESSPKTTVKETTVKTVHDVEKKIQSKQVQEEKPSWVTNRNLKKSTPETRTYINRKSESEKSKYRSVSPSKVISKPTDVITSSYGPGPLDADGRPLFGIKALRNGATNYQVKGTVIRQEFHSRNGGEPEGTVSVTAYSTEPEDLEKLLQSQGEKPSRLHGLAAITTTKKFGGETGATLKEVHSKEERASLDQFTHNERRVIDNLETRRFDTKTTDNTRSVDTEEIRGAERREEKRNTEERRERMDRREDRKTVRQSSVKSITEKYIKNANETSRTERSTYPKAGLILRTTNMKDSVSSDSSAHAGLGRTDSEHSLGSIEDTVVTSTTEQGDGHHTTTTVTRTRHVGGQERSFLDSTTKVSGVQDILTRMKNADIVIQEGDSCEDTEARALLNKFLGATVLMAGMQNYVTERPGGKLAINQESVRSGGVTTRTTSSRVEQQEVDLDQCWDERLLRKLLEESSDYEQRRRIRARIRTLMAEQEACASAVTEALAAAGEAPDTPEASETREEEEVTVTSSVRRNSSEKTVSSSTTTKSSKVIESMTRPAPKPVSPFAKFRQLEKQNSTNSPKM